MCGRLFADSNREHFTFLTFQLPCLAKFDYCAPVRHSRLKGPADELEKCAGPTKTVRLGSTDHPGRLRELGWDCVVLRGIKTSLELMFKLVFHLVPLGPTIVSPLEQRLPLSVIAGNSWNTTRLNQHPFPIQSTESTTSEIWRHASDSSFSGRMCSL